MAKLELFLIRHGLAAERGPDYPDDSKRPLTEEGIAAIRKEARALNALAIGFDLVVTSPLTRTAQTARALVETLKVKPPVTTSDSLTPAGTPAAVIDELGRHTKKKRIALVGHEPNIGELAATLIGARSAIPFKKGAICRIDFDGPAAPGAGELRWFLTPRILRAIG